MKSFLARCQSTVSISTPRWLGYATAAAATAALGHVETAEASVVVVPVDEFFDEPISGFISRASFQLGSSGAGFQMLLKNSGNSKGFAVASGFGGAGIGDAFLPNVSSSYAAKLTLGQPITPGEFHHYGIFANRSYNDNSQWRTPGTGYLGFEFTDAGGAETGWAEITMDSGEPKNIFTLDEYAYSTAGESLTAGQTTVPEPGSLGLLALGGAGLLAWRQRRAAARSAYDALPVG